MTLLDVGLGLMLLLALVAGSVFTVLLMIAAIGDGRKEDEMSVSEHANYLLNEYGRLQFDLVFLCKPDGESLRNEARNNLETYIAELEKQVETYANNNGLRNRVLQNIVDKQTTRIAECESALISMVQQFFYNKDGEDGFRHAFMSAEEEAATYLVEHGIARWVGKNKSAICFNSETGEESEE